jgi:hypothetical protein
MGNLEPQRLLDLRYLDLDTGDEDSSSASQLLTVVTES